MKRSMLTILFVVFSASLEPTSTRAETPTSLQYEVLYISGKIIYPSQITRPSGPFLLVIKSHSRLKKLVIHVKQHGAGTEVLQANLDEQNDNYGAVINLDPGTYDVTEPKHPELTATLIITQ